MDKNERLLRTKYPDLDIVAHPVEARRTLWTVHETTDESPSLGEGSWTRREALEEAVRVAGLAPDAQKFALGDAVRLMRLDEETKADGLLKVGDVGVVVEDLDGGSKDGVMLESGAICVDWVVPPSNWVWAMPATHIARSL